MTDDAANLSDPSCSSCSILQKLAPWVKLAVGFALVLLFMFVIAPLAEHIPGVKTLGERIDERHLRSTAIFYTDLEESGEGSSYIHDSLTYPPRRP
ncbi:hypothetical protein [Desulforhabdus sp. TSK]|uniref:hypothetical protein n=1 Tax=Desulforhabdus sp. TSK TaxID=2925014 RepID=UPI001FC82035|nr:hypothetical protein [Desulforhabdus sp. TSK]GKT09721.1 hypothetical protein DSTSK_30260 [Desulforhabdus sp. TSK]